MSNTTGRLGGNIIKANAVKAEGANNWGGGLYLLVKKNKAGQLTRSWAWRTTINGKRTWRGLGGLPQTSVDQARGQIAAMQGAQQEGRDVDLARIGKGEGRLTFAQACEAYLELQLPGFKGDKHRKQWTNSLRGLYGKIGNVDMDQLELAHIEAVLASNWLRTPDMTDRLAGRIFKVVDFAAARKARDPNKRNPADRRLLLQVMPRRPKRRIQHHK